MKRTKLFKLQGVLTAALVFIAAIHESLDITSFDLFKVVVAPFGSISLLLFALFLFNEKRQSLSDETTFTRPEILRAFAITLTVGLTCTYLFAWLGNLSQNLEHLVFTFSILIGCVIFAFDKIRNLTTMSLFTGIAEGVCLMIVFLD